MKPNAYFYPEGQLARLWYLSVVAAAFLLSQTACVAQESEPQPLVQGPALLQSATLLRAVGNKQRAFDRIESNLERQPKLARGPYAAALYNLQGDLLVDLEEYEDAEAAYLKGIARAKRSNDPSVAGLLYNNLGLVLSMCAHVVYGYHPDAPCRLTEGYEWFTKAHQRRLKLRDLSGALKSANNAGMAAFASGNYKQAVISYSVAARLARKLQEPSQQRKALASLALCELSRLLAKDCGKLKPDDEFDPSVFERVAHKDLERLRGYIVDAKKAARDAGEFEEIVCESFGRYDQACKWFEEHPPRR